MKGNTALFTSSVKHFLRILAFAAPLSAAPITWTLSDVKLSDGSSVTGSFVFNPDAPAPQTGLTDFNVSISGGSVLPNFVYTPNQPFSQLLAYSYMNNGQPVEVFNLFRGRQPNGTAFELIYLETTTFLSDAGGVVPLDLALTSGQLSNGEVSTSTEAALSGSLVGSTAPEPGNLPLAVIGGLVLAYGLRRRATTASSFRRL